MQERLARTSKFLAGNHGHRTATLTSWNCRACRRQDRASAEWVARKWSHHVGGVQHWWRDSRQFILGPCRPRHRKHNQQQSLHHCPGPSLEDVHGTSTTDSGSPGSGSPCKPRLPSSTTNQWHTAACVTLTVAGRQEPHTPFPGSRSTRPTQTALSVSEFAGRGDQSVSRDFTATAPRLPPITELLATGRPVAAHSVGPQHRGEPQGDAAK